jgi:hypothetical protein
MAHLEKHKDCGNFPFNLSSSREGLLQLGCTQSECSKPVLPFAAAAKPKQPATIGIGSNPLNGKLVSKPYTVISGIKLDPLIV